MTLKDEDRKFVIESHVEKSQRAVEIAEKNLEIDAGTSARLSYDSAFHITVALFISEGLPIPSTHEGLNSRLYEVFVRGERTIPDKVAATLGALETDRNIAAYKTREVISDKQARDDIEAVKKYFSAFHLLIEENLKKLEIAQQNNPTNEEILANEVRGLNLITGIPKIYTKTNSVNEYTGKILHVDKEKAYSVQLTGKISLIVHQHKNLERIPKAGEIVKINYKKNERGTIRTISQEKKNSQKFLI